MTFLSFFLAFRLLAMLYGVLDSNFKLCTFYCQCIYQGGIEKASGQFLGLIVMSQIWDISVLLPLFLFHVKNHVCLSRGVHVAGVTWWAAMRI
jgi:hypothetical protein